jgi:hypothetical protein
VSETNLLLRSKNEANNDNTNNNQHQHIHMVLLIRYSKSQGMPQHFDKIRCVPQVMLLVFVRRGYVADWRIRKDFLCFWLRTLQFQTAKHSNKSSHLTYSTVNHIVAEKQEKKFKFRAVEMRILQAAKLTLADRCIVYESHTAINQCFV